MINDDQRMNSAVLINTVSVHWIKEDLVKPVLNSKQRIAI